MNALYIFLLIMLSAALADLSCAFVAAPAHPQLTRNADRRLAILSQCGYWLLFHVSRKCGRVVFHVSRKCGGVVISLAQKMWACGYFTCPENVGVWLFHVSRKCGHVVISRMSRKCGRVVISRLQKMWACGNFTCPENMEVW
jgi:hypothetical protein